MSGLIAQVKQDIVESIKSDALVLPTLPEVALRVRSEAEDPESSLNSLGKLISNDPALTARVIKVANSAFFRTSKEISDLKMALMRLGMEYTANLAIGLAMEQMFQATSNIIDKRMRDIWQRSSEIAGICHVLCSNRLHLKADQAMLAGLTYKIGALPVLTYAEEHPSLLKDSFTLDAVIESLYPAIGSVILKKWDFPVELQNVPTAHLQFNRDTPRADYADIVTVAMLQSYMGTDSDLGNVDYSQVSSFARLGLVAEEHINSTDVSEEMEEAMRLLNG